MGILLKEKKEIEFECRKHNFATKELSRELAKLVTAQWFKANSLFKPPVTISEKSLAEKIGRQWFKISKFLKNAKPSKEATNKITNDLDSLFDIISCTLTIIICTEAASFCNDPENCKLCARVYIYSSIYLYI
nr:uncharacterized protein LOC124806431 [Hydra vulgaris]